MKYWGNKQMTSLVNWLAGTKLGDVSSGFRAINREAILNLNLSGNFTYTHETIIDLALKNLRLISIPIKVKYYPERKSRVAGNLVQYTNRRFELFSKPFEIIILLFFSSPRSVAVGSGWSLLDIYATFLFSNRGFFIHTNLWDSLEYICFHWGWYY